MFKVKTFQRRIFLALLAVALLPAALLLLAGTLAIREIVSATGTAGPWSSLAESGHTLLEGMEAAGVEDPQLLEAARSHREALTESLRFSRLLALVGDRLLALVPPLALALALLVGVLAFLTARQLSRGFSRPIGDLVGWTERIAREEPLPPGGPADGRGVQEFARLREALRTMAHQLEEGRREAIRSARLRSWTDMARRVAHELKNPLTPMRMAAATAARAGDPAARAAGEVLLEEITRLDEMARTFSQFGRMPEGPPSPVELAELLQGLVAQHQGGCASLALSAPPSLPLLTGHYDALQRAFRNLLVNALEAAGSQGRVEVALREEEGSLVVEIRDSGPGIPPRHLEEIWEPDFTTKRQGTGLGLAMVRQTVRLHQGSVQARNHPQGGAVFTVVLPLEGEAAPGAEGS